MVSITLILRNATKIKWRRDDSSFEGEDEHDDEDEEEHTSKKALDGPQTTVLPKNSFASLKTRPRRRGRPRPRRCSVRWFDFCGQVLS